jgi:hypothetical protein
MSNCGNCGNVLKPGGGCGCLNCPPGDPGQDGVNGLSAYEIWLGEGNVGTEQDFLDSLVGPPGEDGEDGIAAAPKICFYDETISTLEVSASLPDPTIYHFPPGYGNLTYTNNSGETKDFIVHVSYDCRINETNINFMYNHVDAAIVKTVAAIDSVEYQEYGLWNLGGNLMNGNNIGDFVTRNIANDNVLTDQGDSVEWRFQQVDVPYNTNFFKKVTLNDTESISLKFKSPEPGINSTLIQAQIAVLEC